VSIVSSDPLLPSEFPHFGFPVLNGRCARNLSKLSCSNFDARFATSSDQKTTRRGASRETCLKRSPFEKIPRYSSIRSRSFLWSVTRPNAYDISIESAVAVKRPNGHDALKLHRLFVPTRAPPLSVQVVITSQYIKGPRFRHSSNKHWGFHNS
jgi:hypothetical protein